MNSKIYNGRSGGQVISDTTARTGLNVHILQCITDVVIASTDMNVTGLAGVTLPAGTIVTGSLTTLDLTSGTVIAYQ